MVKWTYYQIQDGKHGPCPSHGGHIGSYIRYGISLLDLISGIAKVNLGILSGIARPSWALYQIQDGKHKLCTMSFCMMAILGLMSGTGLFFYKMSVYVVEIKIDHFPLLRMVAITD